ncbi:MAG TPA: M48 family metalloprotease [Candidatus Angelobacter sp.]|nr:M48 family metalloprotease [Candidatus Angelobacter sp.]
MKFRALLLSSILAVLSLSVSGVAQNDKQQSQSSSQTQVQQQPATNQSQPVTQDQSQPTAQNQSQPATENQSQPVAQDQSQTAAQDQSATDQNDSDQAKDNDKKHKEKKYPHDGGKDDVSAIGNRHVGGIDWYSTETDIKVGKTYAQQIEQSMKFIHDPVVTEYVNRIGQNLVRNSDAKVPFTIKVVDSDEINAMALPGGFFYVNSGLILAADNEAELAGVMAHEIAHVALRHGTRGQTRADIANIMSIPLIFVGGGIGYAARQVAGIGLPMTFLKFSRGFEAEADFFGVQYMYKAGYDPNQFVNFFEKIQAQEKKKPGSLAKAFSTHPQTPDRIEKTQEEIATILPPRDEYIENTSEFNDVKARLAAIENRHKVQDDRNPNKPTLRRTANTSNDGDKKDDGRPTLHRRDNP